MTIALISDIHANFPALEATLADIDARKPDAVYCLGDLIGYNIWANEVIAAITERGIATIAGNHDLKVKLIQEQTAEPKLVTGKGYAYEIVGEKEKEYLLTLPAQIRLEFQLSEEKLQVLFVHGSPRKVDEYLLKEMDEKLLLAIMQEANADVLCFGHSHKPYHRIITDNNKFKHAINIGSVGKPKDGDARACYVLLHINLMKSSFEPSPLQVEFIRVDYDVEKAAKAVEKSPLPSEFADMLRKAY
jgi:putative phosphoesterase